MLTIICLMVFAACKEGSGPSGNTDNQPPNAFELVSPEAGTEVIDLRPTLSWEAAIDPDGDAVRYELFLDTESDPATMVASGLTETEFTPEDRLSLVTEYYWKVVAKDDQGGEAESDVFMFSTRALGDAELATDNAAFPARNRHVSVVYDDKLWVLGGFVSIASEAEGDSWFSEDGITWTDATTDLNFPRRFFHDAAVFDNKMWLIGGLVNGSFANDVWFGEDGETWKEITPENSYPVRGEYTSVIFDEKLWIIAGDDRNDVWFFDLN